MLIKKSYQIHDPKRVRLIKRLVYLICKDLRPLYIVENEGFRYFVLGLDSQFVLPSRKSLREKWIPEIYNDVKNFIKREFNDVLFISITTDMWSSPTNVSFSTITAHYFCLKEKKMQTKILKCSVFEARHFAPNIAKDIEDCLKDYGIQDKTSGATSDNEASVRAGIRITNIPDAIGCLAHHLNLVHDDGLKLTPTANALIDKFANLVTQCRVSRFFSMN